MKHQEINEKRLQFNKQQRLKYLEVNEIESWLPMDFIECGNWGSVRIGENVIFDDTGFNYVWDGEKYLHTPHSGKIIIEKDVEIHSGTNIVRGTADDGITFIGEGTKIDYNCHIAHNVKIGKHCLIVAGTIIGGSTEIGDNCYLGIGCMIKNKVKIGNNVFVGMGAVVINDVPDNCTVVGNPAKILKK